MAELLAELVPSMEVSRLVSSGTEATMSAIRVARGFTRRDKIIKFRGCYHGHSDGLLVKGRISGIDDVRSGQCRRAGRLYEKYTGCRIQQQGKRQGICSKQIQGDCRNHSVEPVAANMGVVPPKDDFLAFLREITTQYGALLYSFDEVITGFRLALGGAQGYFGIKPDLSTFGKIIGGGTPVGAYGGREDIMRMDLHRMDRYIRQEHFPVIPIATAAGLSTLRILKEDTSIYERLEKEDGKDRGCCAPSSRKQGLCQPDRFNDEHFLYR